MYMHISQENLYIYIYIDSIHTCLSVCVYIPLHDLLLYLSVCGLSRCVNTGPCRRAYRSVTSAWLGSLEMKTSTPRPETHRYIYVYAYVF